MGIGAEDICLPKQIRLGKEDNISPLWRLKILDSHRVDLDTTFTAGEILGIGPSTLREIIEHLTSIYCDAIGVEYMYIRNPERVEWIQNWLNVNDNHPKYDPERKKHILKKLNEAVSFEGFLHTKYVGQKRFSLEGNESLIPALDAVVEKAAEMGVEQFVMGMAHRGRLNVLTNIFGKRPRIFLVSSMVRIMSRKFLMGM